MSGRARHNSPYELGELKPSPDRHKKAKKSKKSKRSHATIPEAKVHIHTGDDEDDDVQIIEAGDHGEEEGGSLTIKPPPLGSTKHKGHKRKKEKHSSRGRGEMGGDKEHRRPDKFESHRVKEPLPARDTRDAREIVRERKKEREMKEKEIAKEMREREARKREESIKERERLERMELERRRDRQMREEVNQARQQQNRSYNEARRREKERKHDRPVGEERSRSRDQRQRDRGQGRTFPPPPRLQEDRAKREPDRHSPSPPRSLPVVKSEKDSIQDTRMVVVDKEEKYKPSDTDRPTGREKEMKRESEVKKEPVEMKKEAEDEEEEEESGESGSDSEDSDSDSSSGEEEDSSDDDDDDEEDEEEGEDNQGGVKKEKRKDSVKSEEEISEVKLRSKFDDHSDVESAGGGHSDQSDNFMPESPELSDVELRPEDSLPPYYPAISGCRSVEEFNCLNRIEEGTYGVVYRALDKKTDEIVALKRLKMEKEKEGFPITSLREINTLLKAQHENIVTVREIVVGSNMDKIYIVMDFVEHDLKSLMERMKNPFLVGEVKTLLQQLLRAVRHMHDNWILHRDLKTSNLLLSHQGILKVGDFGLAREYGSPLRHYTPVVVTLWYRAPELLLGTKEYSCPIDMWSVGCIFAEFLLMKALWPGKSEIDQINKIFKDLGTPTEAIWPGMMDLPGCKKVTFNQHQYNVVRNRFGSYFTDSGFDLMNKLFAYDPSKRITAEDALYHEYFSESPLPVDPAMFPTWPARSEEGRKHASSPKPPSGGKAYQKLMDDEENLAAGGFHMPSAAKGASAQGMGFALKF